MQILTIRTKFEPFKYKFEPFKRGSKHSNANSNRSKGIQGIRMPIWSPILTIWKGFEAFEAHERESNANSNHSNQIRMIRLEILTV